MGEQIRPIRRYIDDDLLIGNGNRLEEGRARRRIGVELEDARMIDTQAELFSGAEHAVRLDPADLAALEFHPAGEYRAYRRERIGLPRLHIRSAADHFERCTAASIDLAER